MYGSWCGREATIVNEGVRESSGKGVIETSDWSKLPVAPKVSVLMLAYNHEPYLRDAIEGVLMQDAEFPFELVIAEDCSTDSTLGLVMEYQRRYPETIRVLAHEHNVGMHRNHRDAVAHCRGEYIAYCEGDDYWAVADKLRIQVAMFGDDQTVGVVHSDFDRLIWSAERSILHKEVRRNSGFVVPEGYVLDAIFLDFFVTTCTAVVRASLVWEYLNSPLATDDFFGVDFPLMAVAAAKSRVLYLHKSTAVYRVAAGSAMNQGYGKALVRLRTVAANQARIAAYLPVSDSVVKEWNSRYEDALVAYAFRAQDRECLADALALNARNGSIRNKVFAICVRVPIVHRLLARLIKNIDDMRVRRGAG